VPVSLIIRKTSSGNAVPWISVTSGPSNPRLPKSIKVGTYVGIGGLRTKAASEVTFTPLARARTKFSSTRLVASLSK